MNYNMFGGTMKKSDYFKSEFCSPQSKRLVTIGWIAFAFVVAMSVYWLLGGIAFGQILQEVDFQQPVGEIFNQIETLVGTDFPIENSLIEEMETMAVEQNVPFGEIFKNTFLFAVGYIIVAAIGIFAFSLVAMITKRHGFAITALVLSFFSSVGLLGIIAPAVLLYVMLTLNREYNQYIMFSDPNRNFYNNEPDFSV